MAENSTTEYSCENQSEQAEYSLGKGGRKRFANRKFEDYEQAKVDMVKEIELDAFLEKLHCTLNHKEPPSVSHWSDHYNDKLIRKYFKMRLCTVGHEDFLVHYLHFGSKEVYNNDQLDMAAQMEPLLNFLDQSTSYIDFTEENLFSQFPDEQNRSLHREWVYRHLQKKKTKVEKTSYLLHEQSEETPPHIDRMASSLKTNMARWVTKLAHALRMHPSEVMESIYEQIFEYYLELFGWNCYPGNSGKLGIPYGKGKVFGVPDLLPIRNELVEEYCAEEYCAVVKVKRMIMDPALKHAFDKKGILSKPEGGPKPPKVKCVNFDSEEASTAEQAEEDEAREHASELGGSPVSESQRKFIELFFGQLFGSVLALDCTQPHSNRIRPRLGIGVVGFRGDDSDDGGQGLGISRPM